MSRTRSLGVDLLLALSLVAAWIPAAMIATPDARASAGGVPVEVVPALDEEPASSGSETPSRA